LKNFLGLWISAQWGKGSLSAMEAYMQMRLHLNHLCVKALSAPVWLNAPDQPHLDPPPSALCHCPRTAFRLWPSMPVLAWVMLQVALFLIASTCWLYFMCELRMRLISLLSLTADCQQNLLSPCLDTVGLCPGLRGHSVCCGYPQLLLCLPLWSSCACDVRWMTSAWKKKRGKSGMFY